MSKDLIERLRRLGPPLLSADYKTLAEAADRIDALEAKIAELVAALTNSRRAFNYYECPAEQWFVAEERRLRNEAVAQIDAALAKVRKP